MESMLQFGVEYLSYSLDLHLSEVEHVMRLPSGHNIKKTGAGNEYGCENTDGMNILLKVK